MIDIKTFNENGIHGTTMEEVMDNFEPSENLALCALIIVDDIKSSFDDNEYTDVGDSPFYHQCVEQITNMFPMLDSQESGIVENYIRETIEDLYS